MLLRERLFGRADRARAGGLQDLDGDALGFGDFGVGFGGGGGEGGEGQGGFEVASAAGRGGVVLSSESESEPRKPRRDSSFWSSGLGLATSFDLRMESTAKG